MTSQTLSKRLNGPDRKLKPINWPLILGIALILFIAFVSVYGPEFAPRDPLEQHTVEKIEGTWYTPPFPLFTPTYPLGSDSVGRDILSRLLYAVRPTLSVVAVVATARLLVGLIIGLIAGWSTRWPGRLLDTLISAALSIPVLLVALGGVAAVGVESGVIAFIIGLSITGWVDTARIVRELTESVRSQPYIEAALAMGASTFQVFRRHVLRHLASLIWILFAFEISGTLMVTAALGFLGYYIGGSQWVQVEDTAVAEISGAPELGQMLATAQTRVTQPWGILAVGSVVFVTVLGFNLFAEGLRIRQAGHGGRRTAVSEFAARVQLRLEESLLHPLANLMRTRAFRITRNALLAAAAVGAGGWYWLENRPLAYVESPLAVEGQPQWASASGDLYGTRWTAAYGPSEPTLAWTFEDESGFSGGPAVTATGAVFAVSKSGFLYALSPDGETLWRAQLEAAGVGAPALGLDGSLLYVADMQGGLSAYSLDGERQWYFLPEAPIPATAGPVVSPAGNIYYTVGGGVQAVTAEGEALWSRQLLGSGESRETVFFDPTGEVVFLETATARALDGAPVEAEGFRGVDQFITGGDGNFYIRDVQNIGRANAEGKLSDDAVFWENWANYTTSPPEIAGVTAHGVYWLFYHSFARTRGLGTDMRIVWLDAQGELLGNISYPTRNARVIAVDQRATAYICGNRDRGYGAAECQAFAPKTEEALWIFLLPDGDEVVGGAVIPGRMYITTADGYLYALGLGEDLGPVGIAAQPETFAEAESAGNGETSGTGPIDSEVIELLTDEGGFSGAPVVSADESVVYIASRKGLIYALNVQEETSWTYQSETKVVGTLALHPNGDIYATLSNGGLARITPDGQLAGIYPIDEGYKGVSGAVVGTGGELYYVLERGSTGYLQAMNADGQALWRAPLSTGIYYKDPQVTADGEYILLDDEIHLASNGQKIEHGLDIAVDGFVVGQDGRVYVQNVFTLIEAFITQNGVILSENTWSSQDAESGTFFLSPLAAGATNSGTVWVSYGFSVDWFSREGKRLRQHYFENGYMDRVVGVEEDATLYVCGRFPFDFQTEPPRASCMAISPESQEPLWAVVMGGPIVGDQLIVGGALVSGRLYVATVEGKLFAIGSGEVTAESPQAGAEEGALIGPANSENVELLRNASGFTGAPAASPDGQMLFVAARDGQLYALKPQGEILWNQTLDTPAVGSPLFHANGSLYVVLDNGSLMVFSPTGEILGTYSIGENFDGVSGPVAGPEGNVYFTVQRSDTGYIQAMTAEGEPLWRTELETSGYYRAPIVTPEGKHILFKDEIYLTGNGKRFEYSMETPPVEFFMGGDEKVYVLTNVSVSEVFLTPGGLVVSDNPFHQVSFDEGSVPITGVTEQGTVWYIFSDAVNWYRMPPDTFSGFSWLRNHLITQVIGIDDNETMYVCGRFPFDLRESPRPACAALRSDSEAPIWRVILGGTMGGVDGPIVGGILVRGRLYVVTTDGRLMAIGSVTP